MPFRPIGNGLYKDPHGKTYTKKQVAAYYATDGFKREPKKQEKKKKK